MHVATDTDIREALRHVADPEIGVNCAVADSVAPWPISASVEGS